MNFNVMTSEERVLWLAKQEMPCATCQLGYETIEGTKTATQMGLIDCPTCGGTGKVPRFPTLRRVCPCATEGGDGRGFTNFCDGINHWLDIGGCKPCYVAGRHLPDCVACQGRGWVIMDSLETEMDACRRAGIEFIEFIFTNEGTDVRLTNPRGGKFDELDFWGHDDKSPGKAFVDALYEVVKAEVKE